MVDDIVETLCVRYGNGWAEDTDANIRFAIEAERLLADLPDVHLIGAPELDDHHIILQFWVDRAIPDLMTADQVAFDNLRADQHRSVLRGAAIRRRHNRLPIRDWNIATRACRLCRARGTTCRRVCGALSAKAGWRSSISRLGQPRRTGSRTMPPFRIARIMARLFGCQTHMREGTCQRLRWRGLGQLRLRKDSDSYSPLWTLGSIFFTGAEGMHVVQRVVCKSWVVIPVR